MPQFRISFYHFTNINNTIRLREGVVLARLSDLLEGAPEAVLRSLAHILLAKIYRKPIPAEDSRVTGGMSPATRSQQGAFDPADSRAKTHSLAEWFGLRSGRSV